MIAELAARVTSAGAALGDFRREGLDALASGPEPDWASWAHRLGTELGKLLEPLPGCAAILDEAQLGTVLDGLDDAAELRHKSAGSHCDACETAGSGLCADHERDLDLAERYAATARQLRQEAGR